MKEVHLKPSLATSLASGHPWVYRDHVGEATFQTGTWVKVVAGSFSAWGLWDAESAIAVRIFSTEARPDDAWVRARVTEAYELRKTVREGTPAHPEGTSGYRLLFGEADGLPGIVVDVYGNFAVLVSYSKSLGALTQQVANAVIELPDIVGVVRRIKVDDQVQLRPLSGEEVPEQVEIQENGMRLIARLGAGQKTGLFFDHRDNRAYVREQSAGKRVLNLFSYTGGFSVAAALGGASQVTSVDIARPAVEDSVLNFKINGLKDFPHQAICEDVFAYLERIGKSGEQFDLVVCDPPSFARNRAQLKAAEKAYRKVMAAALAVVSPGGIFCGASCTSQVGPAAFRLALCDAARKARVRLQITRDIGQPADHPVLIGHEEGRYLKFLAGRVLPRC